MGNKNFPAREKKKAKQQKKHAKNVDIKSLSNFMPRLVTIEDGWCVDHEWSKIYGKDGYPEIPGFIIFIRESQLPVTIRLTGFLPVGERKVPDGFLVQLHETSAINTYNCRFGLDSGHPITEHSRLKFLIS